MSGHNPKTNFQSDEHQDVAALLRVLPQVAAPMNFDMMLKARIAQAKMEQKADVTALLQELPRVAAPSDFEFKLRARIAQAKSKEEKVSLSGWFSEIFGRSLMQTGAAMAAVALFVGAMTFQMMKPVDNPTGAQASVASSSALKTVSTPEVPVAVSEENKSAKVQDSTTFLAANSGNPKIKTTQVKFASDSPKTQAQRPKPESRIEPEIVPVNLPVREDLIASNTVLIKHSSSGETRVVKVAEVSFGLQSASFRSNSSREPQNVEMASAQIIY